MRRTGKEISARIREEYGTMKRFCRLKGANYSSLRSVLAGFHVPYIKKILLDEGLINDINELPKQKQKTAL